MKELQKKQLELDKFICESNNIADIESLYDNKIIALDVELSEFMNEVKTFKHWKKNKEIDRSKVIEEACDCLHFILSIANDKDIELKIIKLEKAFRDLHDVNFAYMCIKEMLWKDIYSGMQCNEFNLGVVLGILIYIIEELGFTYEDLIKEYDRKYEINIQRQVEGY